MLNYSEMLILDRFSNSLLGRILPTYLVGVKVKYSPPLPLSPRQVCESDFQLPLNQEKIEVVVPKGVSFVF